MYPCGIYESFDEYDSFITHFNRKDNFELLKEKGEDFYNDIQREKRRQLDFLLSECNDGRRKTFFCTGVNLLETRTIEEAVRELKTKPDFENMTVKEKGDFVSEKFKEAALKKGVEIKLRKSKKV